MSGSLLYSLPLRVALPPLSDSIDRNMNIVNLDKSLSKELNISSDSANMAKNFTEEEENGKVNLNQTGYNICNNEQETDGSLSLTSSEKQEWSVTLYDVDSKGSVSEEDLARLVTMLYKAAGASITKSPENNSKKIKLRLSVAPDPTKVTNRCCGKHEDKPESKLDPAQTQKTNKEKSPVSHKTHKEKSKTTDTEKSKLFQSTEKSEKDVKASERKEAKVRRSGSKVVEDGKENIQSVQKVTDSDLGRQRVYTHRKKTKKRHSRSHDHPVVDAPVAENKDRRQYYEHLMGIESEHLTRSVDPNLSATARTGQPDSESVAAVINKTSHHSGKKPTTPRTGSSVHKQKQVHFESQGHSGNSHKKHSKRKTAFVNPLGVNLHIQRPHSGHTNNLDQVTEQGLDTSFDQELEDQLDSLYVLKHKTADIPVSMEHISPHHMRRHRNREKDHIRAMKQVAKWIQQQPAIAPSSDSTDSAQTHSVVLKHEHHHLHEHHHHYHFYHYYET